MWITEICNCLQNMSSVHHDAASPLLSPILPGLLRASWVPPSIPVHLHPIAQNPDIDSYKYACLTSNKGAKQSNGGKIAFSVNGAGREHIHACQGQTQVPMTAGLRPLAGPSSCPSSNTTQRGLRQTGKHSPSFSWKPVCIFFSWGSSVSADSEAGVALSIAKCSSLCLRHLLLLSPGAHLQLSAIFLLPPGAPCIWHGFEPHMKTETPSLCPGFFPIPSVCFTTSLPHSSSHFSWSPALAPLPSASTLSIPPLPSQPHWRASAVPPLPHKFCPHSLNPTRYLILLLFLFSIQTPSYPSTMCSKDIAFLNQLLWHLYEKSINHVIESQALDFLFISLILFFFFMLTPHSLCYYRF